MIQRGGMPCPVSPSQPPLLPGLLLGVRLVGAQKIVPWPNRGCLKREATGFKFAGSGFCGREKSTSEIGGAVPPRAWPPRSPRGHGALGPMPTCVLGTR